MAKTTTAKTQTQEWEDVGPGPGMNERIRVHKVEGGWLVATVVQRRGYIQKSLMEGANETKVTDEETRAITFMPTKDIITFKM